MAELYTLPDGWEWKKLEKLAKLQNGFAFKSNLFVNEGLPIVRIKNIKNEKVLLDDVVYFNVEDYGKKLDSYQIKKNDILLAMSGATTGKIGLYDTDEISYLNQRVGLFRIENSNLRSYLFYFLSTQIEKNLELSLGAAQPNLSTEQINNIELPLPPLEEQKRIVAKLDNLFAKIDKAIALHQKNIDEANVFMASVLNDVFVELEEKYEKDIVKNILKMAQYGFSNKSSDDGKYPFLRMGDLQNGKILLNNLKYVNLTDEEFKKYKLQKFDLLFNRTNSFELVGKTSIFEEDIDMSFASYLVRLRVDEEKLLPYYLNYYLNTKNTQNVLKEMATKAVNQSNINAEKLKSITIPLPPIKTQQKVVSYLDEISNKMEKIKQIQKEKMQSLKALKASILDQAFKGEL